MRALAFAIALLLACLLTARQVPLFDPDEGYYPATALESETTGSHWDPRLDRAPRWDKPILTYLLIEESFDAFGPSDASARLPSELEGAALVLLVGLFAGRMAGARAGWLAAGVLASTLGMQIFSRAAHPEIAVVLAIVTTELIFCDWLITPDRRRRMKLALAAALATGFGVLAKGPVAIVLPALAAACAFPFIGRRRPDAWTAVRDAAIACAGGLAIAAPWYAWMTARYGTAFLQESLWKHNVVRYTTGAFGHRGSPLYFVVPAIVSMAPWSGLLPAIFRRGSAAAGSARSVLSVCMASSAITAFVFYSLSSSKLANYALVLVPPLSILIALRLDDLLERQDSRLTASERLAGVLVIALAVALLAIPMEVAAGGNPRELVGGAPSRTPEVTAMLWRVVWLPAMALLAAGLAASIASRREIRIASLMTAGLTAPLLLLLAAYPLMHDAYPWHRFGDDIGSKRGEVWLYGYRAPSLTFYAHRPVHQVGSPEQIDRVFQSGEDGWLVIEADTWARLPAHASRATIVDSAGRMLLVQVSGHGP